LNATPDKQLPSGVWEEPVLGPRKYKYGNVPKCYRLFYVGGQSG